MSITEHEYVYLKSLFFDNDHKMSIDKNGVISLLLRGQIRKIGKITFEQGVMVYNQPEKIKHLLKGWNAWTIDEVIYSKLPINSILKYYDENYLYTYTKIDIEKYKEDTLTGKLNQNTSKYESRYFTGHGLRIILPLSWAKIAINPLKNKSFYSFFN